MTRPSHPIIRLPSDPERQKIKDWLPANRAFYANLRAWLRETGYSPSAVSQYLVSARYVLGYLPEQDFPSVKAYLARCPLAESTCASYIKGLHKLVEYLRLRLRNPPPERHLHWEYYLAGLPEWLCRALQAYLAHRSRAWLPERRYEAGKDLLGHLSAPLRWMAGHFSLGSALDLTPAAWLDYLDMRLEKGISPVTVNSELAVLLEFVRYLESQGEPICERLLRMETLREGPRLPKDAAPAQLRRVFTEIERDTRSLHGLVHRCGLMDRAWYLLMLHSGLRTGEVRRMRLAEVDFERRQVRIEQSKGLKDRIVFLTTATITAMQAYLAVRGPADALPEQLFIFRHAPLSPSYCYERLQNYGERCGVVLTPHQLRHSCATLLLNAGAPVTSVQAILGHKWIDTTLGYTRLYDGTLAADYYRAMNEVERQLELVEQAPQAMPSLGELVALVDSLHIGTLNESQSAAVQVIRDGILALARKEQLENAMEDVKVQMLAG